MKARVTFAGAHGQPDDLIEAAPECVKDLAALGLVDPHKDAVAYAASLPQNAAGARKWSPNSDVAAEASAAA